MGKGRVLTLCCAALLGGKAHPHLFLGAPVPLLTQKPQWPPNRDGFGLHSWSL